MLAARPMDLRGGSADGLRAQETNDGQCARTKLTHALTRLSRQMHRGVSEPPPVAEWTGVKCAPRTHEKAIRVLLVWG